MKAVPIYDHYHVTQQLGFKPILYCWCGSTIDLNTNNRKALKAFKAQHDECEQKPREEALQAGRRGV